MAVTLKGRPTCSQQNDACAVSWVPRVRWGPDAHSPTVSWVPRVRWGSDAHSPTVSWISSRLLRRSPSHEIRESDVLRSVSTAVCRPVICPCSVWGTRGTIYVIDLHHFGHDIYRQIYQVLTFCDYQLII